ncbi:hypothetical protein AYK21_02105 [Thermoplasmatales archaeon SG8-52-2]|nr:MAG: hypothetical protein AYK21_02105 [Thermoplasmatales archaeon SG8-52-2]
MKKILPILVIGIFILSSFGAVAVRNELKLTKFEFNENEQNTEGSKGTHNAFGEYGTATWCGYCKYAHGALKELYSEGYSDFYYVSLVDDKNTEAAWRIDQYNIYGFPTVWWDGGYKVNVGAGSVPAAKSAYKSSITSSVSRDVEDVDIDLSATWLGNTQISVSVTVDNNEATTYGGYIRVYITDIASSENWRDTAGNLYTFAFLDYAFNESLSISAGGSWSDSMTWNGGANGYSSVTEDNLMIFAVVFNDEWHQGYSYPPNQRPFDAYYVDESVEYRVGSNRAPNAPSSPNPYDGKTDVDIYSELSWKGEDPDWFDTLTYDIYFGTTNPPPLVQSDAEDTTYNPGILDYETTYYWKIVTNDPLGEYTEGSVWEFTTESNQPPSSPEITGPSTGVPGQEYSYTFISNDSDDFDVYYYIDWGDGNIEEWAGPYNSGQTARFNHIWEEKSTYNIKAKAKDTLDAESSWSYFEIEIPRYRYTQNHFIFQIFEQFPNTFKFLRQMFGF